ncbi:hypothetical protein CR513_11920, partial [Mucuna pruriens]
MKTGQCIFIGYGHDEYGYKLYDLVGYRHDVQFMEDQTIEDIDKVLPMQSIFEEGLHLIRKHPTLYSKISYSCLSREVAELLGKSYLNN